MKMECARVVYSAHMLDAETAKILGLVTFDGVCAQAFKRAVIVPAPVNARTVRVAIEDDLRNALPFSMRAIENIDFVCRFIEGLDE